MQIDDIRLYASYLRDEPLSCHSGTEPLVVEQQGFKPMPSDIPIVSYPNQRRFGLSTNTPISKIAPIASAYSRLPNLLSYATCTATVGRDID